MPEPEAKKGKDVSQSISQSKASPVFQASKGVTFDVSHQLRANTIFVECKVNGITFRKNEKGESGRILIFIDGKKKHEIGRAAFVIKGLSKGKHTVKLILLNKDSQFMNTKSFEVEIPS